MTTQERLLYHQIHPVKIAIDLAAALITLALVWNRLWIPGMIVIFAVPMVGTILVLNLFNLEPLKQSPLGAYVKQYLTFGVEMARSSGLAVMIVGAWSHMPFVIAVGALIVIAAWLNGVFFPER